MTDTQQDVTTWIGHSVVDSSGDKIGKVADIYLDEETEVPEWVAVKTGFLGSKVSFAPLRGARASGDDLQLPFDKERVTGAPNAEADGALSQAEEAELYRHYGIDYGETRSGSGLPEGRHDADQAVARDTTGSETDSAMTRSEEELRAGTRTTEAGRVRLRKHIVTEHQQVTVPVQHEEVRVVTEPITDANVGDALDGEDLSEEEAELVLHQEEVVVDKVVVAKERVRLEKDTVAGQETVEADVRKEVIDTDGDLTRPAGKPTR